MKKSSKLTILFSLSVLFLLVPNVYAQNLPPVVSNIPGESIAEGSSFATINLGDYVEDPDNQDSQIIWTYSSLTNLTVSISSNNIATIGVVDTDWNGSELITFTATDPGLLSDSSDPAEFTVNPVNDAPVAYDDTASTPEDTAVVIDVLANDTDADGDTLTVGAVTQGTNGSVSITNNGTNVTYSPNADFNGSDSFTYTASDGSPSNTATVDVTIGAENDPPVANDDSASTDEDTAVIIDVLDNDTDTDGDPLEVSAVSQGTNGSVSITNNGNDVTYTPNADFNGSDSFTYTAYDGTPGGTDTATVEVTIDPENDAPVANNDTASTDEDTAVVVDVLANDTDVDAGDTLTVSAVSQGTNGSVSITNNGNNVTYTPNADFNGSDSFTYTAYDGTPGSTDTATVNVTIGAENDPPVANDDSASTDEDTAVIIDVLDNDTDTDGDPLEVSNVTDGNYGSVSITNNGTNVTYTPDTDFNGPDIFTYTASDGNGGTNTATVSISVSAENDPPVANDDTASTAENIAVDIYVLQNDIDVDGDELTVSAVTGSDHGSVVNNVDYVTYTPDTGFNGPDTFTYTAYDDTPGGIDTARVTLTVTGDFFVQTEAVTEIGETSATGNGDILKLGEPQPTNIGICWSDEEEPTISDITNEIDPPFELGLFSVPITDLEPGTIYYVRAYARDRNKAPAPVYGSQRQFTTHIEPLVTTLPVSRTGDTVATANGSIIELGEPSPDDHGFCWSTDSEPIMGDIDDSCIALGPYSGTVPYAFNYKMTGLLPDTTYYVRAYATNAVDTVYGDDDFFITDPLRSSSGKDDSYDTCFIETTRSKEGQWNPTKRVGLFFLAVVAVFFLNRLIRHRFSVLMVVTVILLGVSVFASNSYAAEGAAAGAPPQTESTETVPGVGVPTPLEEEQSTLEQLRELEKKQDAFIPVAVSSAGTAPSSKKSKPWYLHAGLGYTYIGSEVGASFEGESITNEVDSAVYPLLRSSYGFSDNFSVELTFSGDYYSGNVKNSPSDDGSKLSSYTFSLSGVYYAREYNPVWIGTMRPLVLAGVGYRIIDADLDFPVSGYKPGVGFSIGTGFQKGNVEVRLSYGFFKHDADGPKKGYSADDQLDTSGVALEISYRFNIF
ncbi:Ig-like domain-containing protein [Thermodesulfobacteriota bacterium]